MANVGVSAIKLIDSDGDPLDDGSGKLNVNATLVNSDDINIGNVVLQTDAGTDIYAVTAETDASPNFDARLLLGTHSLLSARSDASTTVGLTCEDSTHNALHVAISDGAGIANVDANNALLVDVVAGGVLESAVDGLELLSSGIKTSVDTMAEAIYADDANWTNSSSKHMLVGGLYESSEQSVTDGDVAPLSINDKGMLKIDIKEVGGVNSHWFTSSTGSVLSPLHVASESYVSAATGVSIMAVCSGTLGALDAVTDGEYTQLQVNADGALYVEVAEIASLTVGHDITGMQSDNHEDVDDTTAERISSTQACKRVDMQADPANTGYIYVGGSDVSATKGIRLAAGDFYSVDVDNLTDIWVLASVDGEDIHFTYFT